MATNDKKSWSLELSHEGATWYNMKGKHDDHNSWYFDQYPAESNHMI